MTGPEMMLAGSIAVTPGRDAAHAHYTDRLHDSVGPVTRRIGHMCGEPFRTELDRWRAHFGALPRTAATEVVGHPFFSYCWLQLLDGCLATDVTSLREWVTHLGRFTLIPATAHGVDTVSPAWLPASRGVIRFPGHPWHLEVTDCPPLIALHVADDGDGVLRGDAIRLPGELLLGQPEATAPVTLGSVTRVHRPQLPGTAIEVDAGDPWVMRLLASMNDKPATPGYPAPDLEPLLGLTQRQVDDIGEAFALIEQVWPELASEIRAYVRLFVPYRSEYHSSFTEACMMGAVFLSEAMWPFSSRLYTAEHLLHEAAHLRLTLIEELDPLVVADEEQEYRSPWRKDPRPLSGLLQAIFAFARIAAFHRRAYEITGDTLHDRRHHESVMLLIEGMAQTEAGPPLRFTDQGERLWAEIRAEAVAT